MTKHVVFDFDMTLFDTRVSLYEGYKAALKSIGVRAPAMEDAMLYSKEDLNTTFNRFEKPEKWRDFFISSFIRESEKSYIDSSTPYPDTLRTLKLLRRSGFIMSIASNNSEKNIDRLLRRFDLRDYFSSICGYERLRPEDMKPSGLPILKSVYEAGGDSDCRIWCVGDSPNDALAALNANANPITIDRLKKNGDRALIDAVRRNIIKKSREMEMQ